MKIYHVAGTRSIRPIWLCYELDVAVEVETIDFSASYRASPEWRAISPAGKVPALTDGALTMFESGAMVSYLLERYGEGRLRPEPGSTDSALFHQWCWFSEATLIRPLGLARMLREQEGSLSADAREKALESLGVVETALADQEFLVGGAFSAADVMMGYSLHLLQKFGLMDTDHLASNDYLSRLKARDACIRAFQT
jgi:glutathione S-transferase